MLALLLSGVAAVQAAAPGMTTRRTFIVVLDDAPLAAYRGGVQGLAATSPAVTKARRLDARAPASVAYRSFLRSRQDAVLQAAATAIGHRPPVTQRYDAVLSGVAVRLTPSEAVAVSHLAGVQRVVADSTVHLLTDAGPAWIGAPAVWDASGGAGSMGEGVVVGIIDTGINYDSPSFAGVGPVDGYKFPAPARYLGACDPITGAPFCNNKLIGAYDFTGTTPEDHDGHGSHTASTTAGNRVVAAVAAPNNVTFTRTISGVAPHAQIVAYKACESTPAGECFVSATVAAINAATLDAVDVINFSIGGAASDPWSDLNSVAFQRAREAGIFAAVAAGNDGPAAGTVGSPADAPWVLSAAASSHDRRPVGTVSLVGTTTVLSGKSVSGAFGPAPVVYAGNAPYNDPLCQRTDSGLYHGEVVLCDRGTNGRVEKSQNLKAAGAGGMVLANDQISGGSLIADVYAIPGVHISFTDGQRLKQWMASTPNPRVTISQTVFDQNVAYGDITASFSSRGPNPSIASVLKPDVTAPGVDILAALAGPNTVGGSDVPEYGFESGTSMASPHSAGAAALLRAVHPDWTPDQVKSAMETTAIDGTVRKDDGTTAADPFDMGGGRIALGNAAKASLVLDVDPAAYAAADPANGGDPSTLNLPSMAGGACAPSCTWQRRVMSTAPTVQTWAAGATAGSGVTVTVTPSTFALQPGASQVITVTATPRADKLWHFAEVRLTPSGGSLPATHLPATHLPVAAQATPPPPPPSATVTMHLDGNTSEGCTGDGRADLVACDGPFLTDSKHFVADSGPAARWIPEAALDDSVDRSPVDPNWVWKLTAPTTIAAGQLTAHWWASCTGCVADDGAWRIALWADGTKIAEQTVVLPGGPAPALLSASIDVPNPTTATQTIVVTIDPAYGDIGQGTVIFYDSADACPLASTGPCDSTVDIPVPALTSPLMHATAAAGRRWRATA